MSQKLFYPFRMMAPTVVMVTLLLAIVTWGAMPHAVAAGDWYVNPGQGIQTAIDAAYFAGGGTVHVAAGTYYELIILKNGVSVQGAGAIATIINGDTNSDGIGDGSVVSALNVDPTAVLEGFTITNGTGTPDGWGHTCGGGMYNEDSSPTVANCTFSGNEADYGGGMNNQVSSPTVTNCVFSGNGGTGCSGGGMRNNGSTPTITNCTFGGNIGSGMCNIVSSHPRVINCTFSGNLGCGMVNDEMCDPTVTNCTFGGNIGCGVYSNDSSHPTLTNCILWGDDGGEISNDQGSSPSVTYCDVMGGYPGTGNINVDPLLEADFHLQSGSPCIDAGSNSAPWLPATDFDGDDRILDGDNDGTAAVDMGVDESLAPETVRAAIDFAPDTLNLKSKGKYVTIYIELSEGYDVDEIDISSIRLGGTVPALAKPAGTGDYDDDGVPDLMLKFDRAAVQAVLDVGDQVELTVSGKVAGIDFEGGDTIKVTG